MTEREGHDSRAVANRFVRLAQDKGESISILQLVKFVYLAHGWHLGFHNTPLICHEVQAWRHGPVVPEVYHAFRSPKSVLITELAMDGSAPFDAEFDDNAQSLIGLVYKEYSTLSPFALSSLTHKPGTPWHQMRGKGNYATIPNKVIRDYYLKKVRSK